jgi:hypothetical protein
MGQYRPMRRNKRGPLTVVVLAGVLSITLVMRLIGRTPHAQAPGHPTTATPTEFVHPFIPTPQVVKPAIAPCRGRDLHDLVAAIRQSQKNLPPALKKQAENGAAAACRGEADNRKWSAFVDVFSKDASGCVARDSELDSQWNLVQSAVTALDGCVDCTRPRAARTLSCQRADELLAAADKATPSP